MTNNNQTIIDPTKTSTVQYVPVENPGANITQTQFNGNNYDEWSRNFHLALLAKGKIGYVDGTVAKPTAAGDALESLKSVNALVTAWLFSSIEPSLRKSISYRPEAKQVWLDIRSRFFQNNDARIYRLQADLMACRQAPNESLMTYYGRLIKLWDDLIDADPLPPCPCNPCSCTWLSILDERRERQRVWEFLMGLAEKFDSARSQLLAISPLPNLNFIYNRLLQEESMRVFNTPKPTDRPDTMAFATRLNSNHRQNNSRHSNTPNTNSTDEQLRPYCIACLRHGHLYKVCYRYTGKFPDWWGDRPRDCILINETDMSRTVIPDVEGRARWEQIKKNTGNSGSSGSHGSTGNQGVLELIW
ncbi:uncharacterized protein LOC141590488 [Silene latifolia]|uniref:uncharacterized protein LOC141590488 n=1 Tax=Silene latifolia TaxID=37657 RepID=UPI003D76B46B